MTTLLADLIKHLLYVRYIDMETLKKILRVTPEVLEKLLTSLETQDLIRMYDGRVEVSNVIGLAIAGLRAGLTHDSVAGGLNWRDFERYASKMLEAHGFIVFRGLRGGFSEGRFEIDVFGFKESLALAIDCKHWKRTHFGILRNHVERHISRVELLSYAIRARVVDVGFRKGRILPVIVTLAEHSRNVINNVPIVPISKFNDFVLNARKYMEELNLISFKV